MTPVQARMSRRKFLGTAVGTAAALSACARSTAPDLVLTGGEILGSGGVLRPAEALAISGDRILAVGTNDDIRALAGPQTRTLGLDGRSVLPGINDSHLHALNWGLSRPPFTLDVSSTAVQSIADIVQAVGERVAASKPGEWIQGRGWDEPYLSEGRPPTRYDLDAVSPDNPVLLTEFSGHAVWANSAALHAGGITDESTAPPGGVIVRGKDGRPSGVLFENAAFALRNAVPPLTDQRREQAILAGAASMLAFGITSFTDPRVDEQTARTYQKLHSENRLLPRASLLLNGGTSRQTMAPLLDFAWHDATPNPLKLRLAGFKIMADGIPTANKTAWLHEAYEGGGNGHLLVKGADDAEQVEELHGMIQMAHDAGHQLGIHATGDRTIDEAVEGIAQAQARTPREDPRHYVIHADLVSPATLSRMAELRVGANFNPGIKYLIADGQKLSLGVQRAAYEWPFRTALDAGVVVASSSDAPVTDGDWRQGLATCVLRQGKQTGEVSGPEQRISLDEAIGTYTQAGAWQDHAESEKGSILPGQLADLCVLDGRLAETAAKDIPALKVSATFVGGQVVFGDGGT